MLTTAEFFIATQWFGIATLALATLTVLGFFLQWGVRFRLVGVTGFMGVLTGGLFALSLVPLTRPVIPGAVHFSLIYDNGADQAVIIVPPQITESQLEATLRQAASDLFSYGRLSQGDRQLLVRARTIVHPQTGASQPLYLGQISRPLSNREDSEMLVELNRDHLAKLAHPA